ncbi:MAG: hypothetical protein WDO13_04370 [Verrucomicrobiota bacterium]
MSPLAVIGAGLVVVTLLLAVAIALVAYEARSYYLPQSAGIDTHDLIGTWTTDMDMYQSDTRHSYLVYVMIFSTHIHVEDGRESKELQGRWHDDGFWVPNADGSGETEVAHLTTPVDLEFHNSAMVPGDPSLVKLYKVRGSDDEMKAIAARFPAHVTYPPPRNLITYWMTEYDLRNLPWKPDSEEMVGDAYSRGVTYTYHSDDPHRTPLQVTVKNHRVVEIHGGD